MKRLLNINTTGNRKLVNTDKVRWLIWNLPADYDIDEGMNTCPYATDMCRKACYAKKAERMYPQVLPSRLANLNETMSPDFVENMVYTIETEIAKKKYFGKEIRFRIHESGDFYSRKYALDWLIIADHFKGRVEFLAYTKSLPYFEGLSLPDNFHLRASIWDDTIPELKAMAQQYPIYTAIAPNEYDRLKAEGAQVAFCRCKGCSECALCMRDNVKLIDVAIH